jgi:hypothetical protein
VRGLPNEGRFKFPSLWEGLGEGRSYEKILKKKIPRGLKPAHISNLLFSLP